MTQKSFYKKYYDSEQSYLTEDWNRYINYFWNYKPVNEDFKIDFTTDKTKQ